MECIFEYNEIIVDINKNEEKLSISLEVQSYSSKQQVEESTMVIKNKLMKANDGNMLNKNLWKIANVVHKRKFIALNKHVRKEERLKIQ